ncbi:hypothetical protein [Bradyrhizobium archetypum]|uniref:hypothetical protein n=1 Tax=Bradyrhizobium archetypum TaxID=2721160 RepID=UPI001AED18EA|nr:hypothetical protein [Bradyrhizobium archetypum]
MGRAIGLGPVLMAALALSAGRMPGCLLTRPWWSAVMCVALSQFLLSVGQEIYNVQQGPGEREHPERDVGAGATSSLVVGAAGAALGLCATLLASSVLDAAAVLWIWWSPLRHTHSLRL